MEEPLREEGQAPGVSPGTGSPRALRCPPGRRAGRSGREAKANRKQPVGFLGTRKWCRCAFKRLYWSPYPPASLSKPVQAPRYAGLRQVHTHAQREGHRRAGAITCLLPPVHPGHSHARTVSRVVAACSLRLPGAARIGPSPQRGLRPRRCLEPSRERRLRVPSTPALGRLGECQGRARRGAAAGGGAGGSARLPHPLPSSVTSAPAPPPPSAATPPGTGVLAPAPSAPRRAPAASPH